MAPSRVVRTRKLSTRIGLQVIREKELEILENDQQSTPKVETGVEKHEETVSTPFFLFTLLLFLVKILMPVFWLPF